MTEPAQPRRPRLAFRQIALVGVVWIVTRAIMLSEIGYWRKGTTVNYQDVDVFHDWASRIMSTHTIPPDPSWQYPPGAIVAFVLPRLFGDGYRGAFVGMILVADLVTTIALVVLARRPGNRMDGVWLWVFGLGVLGSLPLLRFDVLPTCIAVVALVLVTTSTRRFGLAVGVGVAVKAWPVLMLVALLERRRAVVATAIAAGTTLAFLLASWLTLDNSFGFISHQSARGVEIEAVAGTPWYLRQAITGHPPHIIPRDGSLEILSPNADVVADVLHVGLFVLAGAVLAWWIVWLRRRPMDVAQGRDAAFTAVLLFMVMSEVLSPQYIVWLIGIGAVAVTSPLTRVRRPVATVAVAVLLTRALLACWGDLVSNGTNGAYLLSFRNAALLFAAVDAAIIMWRALRAQAPAISGRSAPP